MSTTHHALGHAPLVNSRPLRTKVHNHGNGVSDKSEDVNRRDENGLTQLHRAVSINRLDLVKRLLKHPKIDVNEKDLESGWTALHRALYLGRLRIAMELLQHKDINMAIEDKDRNTPFDVCLATLPVSLKRGPCPADTLYTWGSNSNFTLGHNDGDDRKLPELVRFPYQSNTITFPKAKSAKPTLYQLSMSKFHTAIATSESGETAKVWGFGTNGRLGLDRKMQLRPASLSGISGNVIFTALGRDHTVLVTVKGEVYTLGNNKYGQLGYASEIPRNGQDPIQCSPRKVILNIAKLVVVGAAASKWHTVVHTETELFTFGFNYGQLGYERKGDIQMGPRKVASIPPGKILQVAASDSATVCLLGSSEVIVFYKYAYHRVSFSLFPYPDWFSTLYIQSVISANHPRKLSCSENKFGIMTAWGDIHVWSYPEVDSDITLGSLPASHSFPPSSTPHYEKPRRVWTYGGDRTHAIDFALGHNGSVIMLTKGGHVYIGTNKGNSVGRNVKWQRIPHLDRVVQVYANPSGAWAALRSELDLTPVVVRPASLGIDLEQSLSQVHLYNDQDPGINLGIKASEDDENENDDETESNPWRINSQGWQDIEKSWDFDLAPLLETATTSTSTAENTITGGHLFDLELQAGKRVLGAHRIILAARSPVFQRGFVESPRTSTRFGSLVSIEPNKGGSTSQILYTVSLKVEFATAVLLLQYLYSDRFDPFWDALNLPKANKANVLKVRQELYHLALELALPTLQAALQYSFTHVCSPSLAKNMGQALQDTTRFKGLADVRLLLKDGATIDVHQVILGHRSPFFYAMFVRSDEWIRSRQGSRQLPGIPDEDESILNVDMKHMDHESMMLVMRHIYTDCGPEMFNDIEKDEMDDLIQLVIDVLLIADELLIERLKEICEYVLGQQVRAKTVVPFLEISMMYAAESLKVTCIDYLCHNIEMALDQRWLENAEDDVVQLVEDALVAEQDSFMPYVRSGHSLPDPSTVKEMNELIKIDGYQYFIPIQLDSDITRAGTRQSQGREAERAPIFRRSGSLSTTQEAAPSTPISIPTSVHATDSRSDNPAVGTSSSASSGTPKPEELSTSSRNEGAVEWPMLSHTPLVEVKDTPVFSQKKTSWGQLSTIDSVQRNQDGHEIGVSEGFSARPSLRDILEHEQVQEHAAHPNKAFAAMASGPAQKNSKLSQKERRKLQQQQVSTAQDSDTSQASPAPQAWAKVPSANAMDLGTAGADGTNTIRKNSATPNSTGTPVSALSLLDTQQGELAIFRAQLKEVPRVAIATSKPVKETTRPSGVDRTFSEAPWRLDAIPEPLRAVTRHQSQMYPKLESSHASSSHHGQITSGGGLTPPPSSSTPNGSSNDGTNSITTPTALSTSDMSILASITAGSPSLSSSSSLSSFAIIQNQQLRDRNLLLKVRHQKKSLYQIQIEEQALSQIRMMNLDRVQAKATEGTGEWFTCEIGH
ncbi:hypothetical protein BG011_000014 [Mortierella polycephala]|uniref:BTB domain-containing protein n=1 Tax=Mortierella polycephala TaxID=41804 RepID=A0A9P6UBM3_9FUNG|nr:hypothetical protein BG011_000014 [Mortierella polycephala]